MTQWIETYRGTVPPWQCDVTEHFTVAYYFDRIEEAEGNLAEALGLGPLPAARGFDVRYARELRAGASFHVESALTGIEADGVRLGHRVVDSVSGAVVTWFDERYGLALTADQRAALAGRVAEWDGPATEERADPASTEGFIPTARGRVKPSDLDAAGCFSLSAMVHRFSNASGQSGAALGMDTAYMQQNRRGFSTFEMTLRLTAALRVDEPYLIETGIGHLGNSSLRMIHRLVNARTGAEVGRLGQFGVNLDLDARRPARWSEEIRAKAAGLLVS